MAIGYIKIFFEKGIVTEGEDKNNYMLNEFGKRNWELLDISKYQPYETDINYSGKLYTFIQEFADTTTRLNAINGLLQIIGRVNNDNPKFDNLNLVRGIYIEYNKEQFDLVLESW